MNIQERLDNIDNTQQKSFKPIIPGSLIRSLFIVLIIAVIGFFIGKFLYSRVSHPMNKKGDTITCGKFKITLNDVQFKKRGTYLDRYTSISDPEWIGIILTVKNTSNRTQTFNNSIIEIQNSKNDILKKPVFNYNIWGAKELNNPELESDKSAKGYIQYANTNDEHKNLRLIFKCSSTEAIIYDISK